MVDTLTSAERSERMSRIKSRDTSPEVALRKVLHALGFRFRLDNRKLPGKPDIVLPRYKTAIFVHGCFWHRHSGCAKASSPKTRKAFWNAKFETNVARDARVKRKLRRLGWRVMTIWECDTGNAERVADRLKRFMEEAPAPKRQPAWLKKGAPERRRDRAKEPKA